jgi:hypothetical protein
MDLAVRGIERVFDEDANDIRTSHVQARGAHLLLTPFYSLDKRSGQSKRKLSGGLGVRHAHLLA